MRIVQLTTDSREHFKTYTAPLPSFGTAPEALFAGFAGMSNVEIHVVCCMRAAVTSPVKITDNIYYHSLFVPKSGWMSTGYLGCSRAVRNLLAVLQPDIVHGQGTERECATTAVISGFPNVVTIHGNVRELHRLKMFGPGIYGALATFFENSALRKTCGVFCNSDYTRELVAPRAKRTWLVPNAIRPEFFKANNGVGKRSVPTFVTVGLVCQRKRQLELLRMGAEINGAGRQFNMIFAGSLSEATEYGAAFAVELKKAEAQGYATFAGFLDMQELISLLDSSHAFLHFPSEEAFGLVVAEALARGMKFFGANLGGIVDITSGIEGAELHDDLNSLKNGIIKWLDEGAASPESAAVEIERRYHPTVIANRHLEIYAQVLNSSK